MTLRARALALTLALLVVGLLGACGEGSDDVAVGAVWAEAAERYFLGMAESFCCEADHEAAAYFLGSGSLDLRMVGGSVATTAEEMTAELERYLTAPDGTRAEVQVDDLYLSADGAVAVYRSILRGQPVRAWSTLYAVNGSKVAGRLYSHALTFVAPGWNPVLADAPELAARYAALWSGRELDEVAAVYSPDALVVDSLTGRTWSGHDRIRGGIEDEELTDLQLGPWPSLMAFHLDGWTEVLAIVETGGDCPMREARRWIVEQGLIVEDIRYRHVPSARRCGLDLADGWWQDFEPPDPNRAVSNLKIAVNGGVIEVVNAEWEQLAFVRWMFERYRVALDSPHATAIWFQPSVDCTSDGSFARRQDDRFGGGHTVTICLFDDEFGTGPAGTRWQPSVARLGLHELAHVWIYDNVSPEDQTAFMQEVGASAWRSGEWGARGVEIAAETIAWGVSGDDYRSYEILPRPSCEELTTRFELLTGRSPVTTCAGGTQG